MAKKTTPKKKTFKTKKYDLLPSTPKELDEAFEEEMKIESGVALNGISLKGQIWTGTITIKTTLPKSYYRYKMHLELDEHPYLRRIDDLNRDHDSSLFKNDRAMRKANDEKISEIHNKLESLRRECETIEFSATVDSLKYSNGGTTLSMRLPDDIVEPFNRQKSRLDLYKISLIPILI
jgi:hypothetical protein